MFLNIYIFIDFQRERRGSGGAEGVRGRKREREGGKDVESKISMDCLLHSSHRESNW